MMRNIRTAVAAAIGMMWVVGMPAQTVDPSSRAAAMQEKASVPDAVPTVKPPWEHNRPGAASASHSRPGKPETPTPPGVYVSIGDSITYGFGVTDTCTKYPDHPVDIEEFCADHFGKSYAERVAYALRDAGVAGKFMNLGISGATVGTVIKNELPWLPLDATIVTLYIGTNDLRLTSTANLSYDTTMQMYVKGYKLILDYLHQKVPKARVILVNVPNQKMLNPRLKGADLDTVDKTSQTADAFINAMYPKYAVVDTICTASTYDPALRTVGLHPNDAGGAPLAASVLKVIEAKTPAAPPPSCTWFNNPAGTPTPAPPTRKSNITSAGQEAK